MIWIFFCCCFLLILQKRKRKCVFNQGELDALEYHSKVSWKKPVYFASMCYLTLGICRLEGMVANRLVPWCKEGKGKEGQSLQSLFEFVLTE